MSGAISASSLAMMGAAAVGGMALAKSMTPKMPTPQIPTPEKPLQATKQPDRALAGAGVKAAAAAAPGMGNAGTFLTGPLGIDASALSLGKNTLLGQ